MSLWCGIDDWLLVRRETQVGVAPGGSLQAVHADVTGNAAARPAQAPGRFQVATWNRNVSQTTFSETHYLFFFFCVADVDVQTEAQHGSDSGWGRALQAGRWAGKRGLRQGMFLCRTHSLQDRGYSVSSCSRLNVQTWIFPSHDWVLTVIYVAGRPRNPQKRRSGATNLTFEFF